VFWPKYLGKIKQDEKVQLKAENLKDKDEFGI
jgi:hypothetical protein